jgi:hypothetical protein
MYLKFKYLGHFDETFGCGAFSFFTLEKVSCFLVFGHAFFLLRNIIFIKFLNVCIQNGMKKY